MTESTLDNSNYRVMAENARSFPKVEYVLFDMDGKLFPLPSRLILTDTSRPDDRFRENLHRCDQSVSR